MWGKVVFDKQRKRWCVRGKWQGKRLSFSQYPTRDGMVPCETQGLAFRLQSVISDDILAGSFSPERYRASMPLLLSNYAEKWLKIKRPELSDATHYDYTNSLKRHVLPVLGNKYMPDINFDDLRDLMSKIQRTPKGKKNVMECLKQLLKDAHRSGFIPQVPEFPKYKGANKIIRPPILYISIADQWKIVDALPMKHRPIFLFMMATGCRPSEARALRKQDIRNNEIVFESAFGRGEKLKTVKQGEAGTFPLTSEVQEILDGLPKNLTPWVFLNPTTKQPYSKNINKIWNKACDDAKVKQINLYNATRHSFACELLNNNVPRGIVSRLLRHSDYRMIERYAEYRMDPLKAAVEGVRVVDFKKRKVE